MSFYPLTWASILQKKLELVVFFQMLKMGPYMAINILTCPCESEWLNCLCKMIHTGIKVQRHTTTKMMIQIINFFMPKKVNRITSLEDDHGNKVTENSSVSMVAKNYVRT